MSAVILVCGVSAVACVARGRAVGTAASSRTPAAARASALALWWAGRLADAGIDGDPARWGRVAAGALVLLTLVAGTRGGVLGAAVVAGVGAVVGLVGLHGARGRGARRADALLPELVEHVARGLRGGHDLRGAASGAAAVVGGRHGTALAGVVDRVDGGAGWEDALHAWVDDHPRRPVQLVAGAIAVAAAAGGRAGSALDGVAATLRARTAVADEARALASQARASAAVLIALPAVVAVGGAAADPKVAAALLGTPWGLGCIALATALDVVGALWMQRITAGGAS